MILPVMFDFFWLYKYKGLVRPDEYCGHSIMGRPIYFLPSTFWAQSAKSKL